MNTPRFPVKAIVKIIVEETKSRYTNSEFMGDDEFRGMLNIHIDRIQKLETYKEINNWLYSYRKMSLDEWVESL